MEPKSVSLLLARQRTWDSFVMAALGSVVWVTVIHSSVCWSVRAAVISALDSGNALSSNAVLGGGSQLESCLSGMFIPREPRVLGGPEVCAVTSKELVGPSSDGSVSGCIGYFLSD